VTVFEDLKTKHVIKKQCYTATELIHVYNPNLDLAIKTVLQKVTLDFSLLKRGVGEERGNQF